MPTNINASVVCHLSHKPELKVGANERNYCKVSAWTAERVKNKEGQWNKEFSSIEALVGGKEAEWLCRDADKGSMILLTGKARIRAYVSKDGTAKGVLDFVQVSTAMLLDHKEEGEAKQDPAQQRPAKPAAVGGGSDGESDPPFNRLSEFELG